MKTGTAVIVGIGVVGVLGLAGYALYNYTQAKRQQQQLATNAGNTVIDSAKQAIGAGLNFLTSSIQSTSAGPQASDMAPSSQPSMME